MPDAEPDLAPIPPPEAKLSPPFGRRGLIDRSEVIEELEVLRPLASLRSQREIADQLFVSRNTVKTHVRGIYRKLGVSTRTLAVARAGELELLE